MTERKQKGMSDRTRDLIVVVLLLVSISSSVGTYITYRVANDSAVKRREDRKLTDYKICNAVRQVIAINNRDRATLVRAQRSSTTGTASAKEALGQVTTPDGKLIAALLVALLDGGRASNAQDVKDRPHLDPIKCQQVIEHPHAPPLPTTTDTSP